MRPSNTVQLQTIFTFKSTLLGRLQEARYYMAYHRTNISVFRYQEFSLTIENLLDIALGKTILPYLTQRVERCFEHMLFHKQEGHIYLPYHNFSFTLFEILEECMKKTNPSALLEIKQDMRNFHKEYLAMPYENENN